MKLPGRLFAGPITSDLTVIVLLDLVGAFNSYCYIYLTESFSNSEPYSEACFKSASLFTLTKLFAN